MLIDGVQLYIFGDCAYLVRLWMQRPYYSDFAALENLVFKTARCQARVVVEQNYENPIQYWTSQDFSRSLSLKVAYIFTVLVFGGSP